VIPTGNPCSSGINEIRKVISMIRFLFYLFFFFHIGSLRKDRRLIIIIKITLIAPTDESILPLGLG
jgi:hypothetical protein